MSSLQGPFNLVQTVLGAGFITPLRLPLVTGICTRRYQERYNVLDDGTRTFYTYLFTGQFRQTSDLIDSPANNGLVSPIPTRPLPWPMRIPRAACLRKISSLDRRLSVHDWERKSGIRFLLSCYTLTMDDGFRTWPWRLWCLHILNYSTFEAGLADKIVYLGNLSRAQTFFPKIYETAKIESTDPIESGGRTCQLFENFKWTKLHDCIRLWVTGRNLKVLASDTKKVETAGVVKGRLWGQWAIAQLN